MVINGKRCPKCGVSVRRRKDGSLRAHKRGPLTTHERADAITGALIGKRWSVDCEGQAPTPEEPPCSSK
jgi:hypothetical protein